MAGGNEPLPDHLRCKRTDGRQWRCSRRVLEDKKLCEIHHLQGRHRQHKTKVPETLKLQREYKKKSTANADSVSHPNFEIRAQKGGVSRLVKLGNAMKRKNSMGESEVLDEAVKKMRLKRGDLQLELIRMVLKREVEKRKKKKKKKKKAVIQQIHSDDDNDSSNSEGELMRDLPNGLMAISPAKNFSNAAGGASSSSSPCDVKIGAADFSALTRRCFRSKNIEPMPIGALQVLPFKKDMVKLRRGKRKKCHWCRRSGVKTLIRCSSCRKQFYCLDCIKDQYFDMQEEVKIACPVCRGTCGCKVCAAIQSRDVECKDLCTDKSRLNKVLHFHYLICMLLPVLKQINQDQSIEIEIEAKIKGRESSDVEIQQAEEGCNNQCSCNNCKTSILDLHRRCSSCSYNLCLSCCRDILQGSMPGTGSIKSLLSEYPIRSKTWLSRHQEIKSECIPCPPCQFGGCGDRFLNLSSIYTSSWVKQLEVDAEEIVGCYELPETEDVFSRCSLCFGTDCEVNGSMQLQEASRREDSSDNYLYYPTIVDIHSDLEHFQKHWSKGQPVIVRNVLQGTSDLSWDPIVMFCTYLKNNAAKSENDRAADCYDWFEVEIGIKQLFMGSFKGPKHASMWHERLKLKGWLSSQLFQEHFPAHYAELLNALPLPEYMDPVSGVLNIPAELPHEISKPDLGPCVYISYGSGDNLVQADSVTKLRYDSYDVVNILAHTTDVPVSMEQLNYIRKLMRKHKEQNEGSGAASTLDEQNFEELGLHDLITEEMNLHKKVSRVSWFSAASNEAHASSRENRHVFLDDEDGSGSDSDTDTDTEVSKFYFGPVKASRRSENHKFRGKHTESLNRNSVESCGAEWDVFRRQDVPKLVEYIRRHSNEFNQTYISQKHMGHPILDQNYFLDTAHKMRLKDEFKIEPWSFEQHVGEAIIIPAGCPYQVRNLKSCVNVVLDFLSPENVTECIQLVDELRLLPEQHKAKEDSFEVKKMALYSISKAIKEIRELTCADNELNNRQ
ncbi:lysine-specific demethylase JMJ28 [Euphorbia lathyris]|uniref:lysine-specific demethylase JMJ28 n=1 Tax=Euphorbia lathyris TaxID=212925 RepID=UPI0033143EA2